MICYAPDRFSILNFCDRKFSLCTYQQSQLFLLAQPRIETDNLNGAIAVWHNGAVHLLVATFAKDSNFRQFAVTELLCVGYNYFSFTSLQY